MRTRILVALLFLASVLFAPIASAQSSLEEAREHFQRGTKLYDEQDFRSALAEFKRAYELAPNQTVLFNIGQAYYQLNEYANALTTLEMYASDNNDKSSQAANRRALVAKELDELRMRVARVEIRTNVPGAEISVDDQVVGSSPLTTVVAIGRRRIAATKPGYTPLTRNVEFASGNAPPVTLQLVDAPKPTTASSSTVTAPPTEMARRPWPGGLVAGSFILGVAGVATGTVFGVLAMENRSTLDDRCANGVCSEDARPEHDALKRNGIISTVGFAAGGLGLGLGLVFALTSRGDTVRVTGQRNVEIWSSGSVTGLRGSF